MSRVTKHGASDPINLNQLLHASLIKALPTYATAPSIETPNYFNTPIQKPPSSLINLPFQIFFNFLNPDPFTSTSLRGRGQD
jgi:hypothetical protein